MRLLSLDTQGKLTLTDNLHDDEVPPYAILSHTWGADRDEFTFVDLQQERVQSKAGYKKIRFCGEQARKDGIEHFWVDTCCIDKANNTELTEAISSMFRWYRDAQKCYVYLADVSTTKQIDIEGQGWEIAFPTSRWFTRGWTLQELLAPDNLEFFSCEGEFLGTKGSLAKQIHEITTIPIAALQGTPASQFSIAERIRWTEKRSTKKKEDRAYCLLGIFEVFIPLIYGEGDHALYRLQKEINEQHGSNVAAGLVSERKTRSLGLCLNSAPAINSHDFIGRAAEIEMLHKILQPGKISSEQHKAVLGGIGGVGKTQLAIAYARQHQESYASILWLNAASESSLYTSLRTVAQALVHAEELIHFNNSQVLACVLEWLSQPDHAFLLIFDNLDEPEKIVLDNFCPNVGRGSVIITTRLPEMLQGQPVRVQPLKEISSSLDILQTRSGRQNIAQDVGALRLARRLNGLPLALVTAGAYLKKSSVSCQQYLDAYEQRWQIDPRGPPRIQEYQDRTLYTTWDLSYSRLEKEDPVAARILKTLAYFDNQEIWYELLHAERSYHLPEWLKTCIGTRLDFESVMGRLVEYCLIEVNYSNQSYSVHSCIHDWTLGALNKGIDSQLYWYAFDCISASLDKTDQYALANMRYARVSQHGVRLTHHRFSTCTQLEGEFAKHFDAGLWIANMLYSQVCYPAARQLFLLVLNDCEKSFGYEHIQTLRAAHQLGVLYHEENKLDKAEEMQLRALNGIETSEANSFFVSAVYSSLGALYQTQGRVNEAEEMLQRALLSREAALGPNHRVTLQSVRNLGEFYLSVYELDDAEQMLQRAFLGFEAQMGSSHIMTLNTLSHLGLLYTKQNRPKEAEETFKRAVTGCEEALGKEHTTTLSTLSSLGMMYIQQGRLEEGETMHLRALRGCEKVFGSDNYRTIDCISHLAKVSMMCGRLEEAEQRYSRVVAGWEKTMGPNDPSTLKAMENLAAVRARRDKLHEAEQLELRLPPDSSDEYVKTVRETCVPGYRDQMAEMNLTIRSETPLKRKFSVSYDTADLLARNAKKQKDIRP